MARKMDTIKLNSLMEEKGFTEVRTGVYIGSSATPAQDSADWTQENSEFEKRFHVWRQKLQQKIKGGTDLSSLLLGNKTLP